MINIEKGLRESKVFCENPFWKFFLFFFALEQKRAGNLSNRSPAGGFAYAVLSAFSFFTSSRGRPAYSAIFSSVNIPSANILFAEFIAPSFNV